MDLIARNTIRRKAITAGFLGYQNDLAWAKNSNGLLKIAHGSVCRNLRNLDIAGPVACLRKQKGREDRL